VVRAFLIGCVVLLLVVGCSGTRSDAPQKTKGHTEATNNEQTRSPEATASKEEARCEGTRTIEKYRAFFTTNDIPGCPNGGLLSGTNGKDELYGGDGEDEVRGLDASDVIYGGVGNDVLYAGSGDDYFGPAGNSLAGKGDDVLYGGPGDDDWMEGGPGEDVIYGGDGNDTIDATSFDRDRDKLYCGKGKDTYVADKKDFVDNSCEKRVKNLGLPV
jgi:Ca2+-binding RTX toxin-like protein